MKNLKFAIIVLSAIIVSCHKPTREDLIEKAFNEYVKQNFDDPNNLNEIISIYIKDTLSATNTISFVENILESTDSTIAGLTAMNDSLYNVHNANVDKILKSARLKSKYYRDDIGIEIISKLYNKLKNDIEYSMSDEYQTLKLKRSALEDAIQNLKEDSTFIVTYEINTRIYNEDKELEIKKYYAQTSNNKINIFDNNSLDLYPTLYKKTYKDADAYSELCFRRINMALEKTKILRRSIDYFKVD